VSAKTTRRLGLGGRFNAAVNIGGAVAHPGDLALCDGDGVVLFPRRKPKTTLIVQSAAHIANAPFGTALRKATCSKGCWSSRFWRGRPDMSTRLTLDDADIRILAALQKDGTLSMAALSERVHLSHSSCWRRLRRLEAAGTITGRVALLDPAKLGLELTAYVSVRTSEHNEEWLRSFARAVEAMPEIVELYRMTGDVDYLMKIGSPTSLPTTRCTRN
jgi:Lrp/AsnC family transcriptional regulator